MGDIFITKRGIEIEIEIDDQEYVATAKTLLGEIIGTIEFRSIEDPNGYYLKMTNAYLDKLDGQYLHQGIGRECVKRMHEITGSPICAAPNDGLRQDDGSHLTGDAPGFVERLLAEKLIHTC